MKQLIKKILREHILEQVRKDFTDEELRNIASKYSDINDFRFYDPEAFEVANDRGFYFFQDITSHIDINKAIKKKKRFLDDELRKIASQYKSKTDFRIGNKLAWRAAINRGPEFYNNITSHMVDAEKRIVYGFFFGEDTVYVGLTYYLEQREKQHLNLETKDKSAVKDYIKLTGIEPKLVRLTDYISWQEAQIKEVEFINKFKSEGLNVLNISKGGNLGAGRTYTSPWTDEKIETEAKRFQHKTDFKQGAPSAYATAVLRGKDFFNKVTAHMQRKKLWTDENLENEAKRFSTLKAFRKESPSAFTIAKNKGTEFFDRITSHMEDEKDVEKERPKETPKPPTEIRKFIPHQGFKSK